MIKQIPSKDIKVYVKNNPKAVILDVRTKSEWDQVGKPDGEKIGSKTFFLTLQFEGGIMNQNFQSKIKNKIQEGLSEEQIYGFLKMKYGEWILYDPVFNRNTYFLWLLPILIFLAGGAIIIKRFYNKK